jgi:hypothetical protein
MATIKKFAAARGARLRLTAKDRIRLAPQAVGSRRMSVCLYDVPAVSGDVHALPSRSDACER